MLRAAIIGCGGIAGGYDAGGRASWSLTHAGAYHLCPDTDLRAAADIDPGKLEAFGRTWSVPRLYTDYRELLAREPLDIVSIAVPTPLHGEVLHEVLRYDIPGVFMEKPLSYSIDEARAMCLAAEGRIVAVNYFRRWNSTIESLRDEVVSGAHGPVVRFTCHYTKGFLHNGTHGLDLGLWFLGDRCRGTGALQGRPVPDGDIAADCWFDFDDARASFLNVDGVGYRVHDVDILCERARFVLTQRGRELNAYSAGPDPIFGQFAVLRPEGQRETAWRDCAVRSVTDLARCVRTGDQPACTLQMALRTLELAHLALSATSAVG